MRFSRLGVFVIALAVVFSSTSCGYYNRIMSRKNLVDGSVAYKARNFDKAEGLFRTAAARDPEGKTLEGRTAQLFLARTLHSQYIGDRSNKAKAEEAINEYKKSLIIDPNEQSSYKAVAGLLENLQRTDEWNVWVKDRANNENILPQHRADALTSLAARENTCANEITDTEATKKEAKDKDGKPIYQYVKPANEADFQRAKTCASEGMALIDKAVALETEAVRNAKTLDIKSLTDTQLKENLDLLKVFESARSYKASLTMQASRVAEMDGNAAETARLKAETDKARTSFSELSEINKNIQAEIDARLAIELEAANANKAANAPAQ
jgi:hypothetical protein